MFKNKIKLLTLLRQTVQNLKKKIIKNIFKKEKNLTIKATL